MTSENRRREATSAALEAQDTLDALLAATCLLDAVQKEISRLVIDEFPDSRRVCERAGFLLEAFQEGELFPALDRLTQAVQTISSALGVNASD